jgi:hypothetical protein
MFAEGKDNAACLEHGIEDDDLWDIVSDGRMMIERAGGEGVTVVTTSGVLLMLLATEVLASRLGYTLEQVTTVADMQVPMPYDQDAER